MHYLKILKEHLKVNVKISDLKQNTFLSIIAYDNVS